MLDANVNFSFQMLHQKWQEFCSQIFHDIMNLKDALDNNEIRIKKYYTLKKIIDASANDVEFMINHKSAFIHLDASLKEIFLVLEEFQRIGALDNGIIPGLQDKILNASTVRGIQSVIDGLEQENETLNDRISLLEDLRSSKYFSVPLIKELTSEYGYSDLDTRKILFYPLKLLQKKKETPRLEVNNASFTNAENAQSTSLEQTTDIIESETSNTLSENNQEINEENVSENSNQDELENQTSSDGISENIQDEQQINQENSESAILEENIDNTILSENLKIINDIIKDFQKIKEDYKTLIDKYFIILENMKPDERIYYEQYVDSTVDDELKKIIGNGDINAANAKFSAIKVLRNKNEIEDLVKEIYKSNFEDESDINFLKDYIDIFKQSCEELAELDEKLKVQEVEVKQPSNVYFLLNKDNEIIMPDDAKELLPVYKKLAECTEVDNIIKKDPFLMKNTILSRNKNVIIQRVNNSSIAFIRVRTGEGTSGNGIFIITASLLSDGGFQETQKRVNSTLSNYSNLINDQIDLIESRDKDYLAVQDQVREKLIDGGMGEK